MSLDIKPSWRNNDAEASQDGTGQRGQRGDQLSYTIVVDDPANYDANKVLLALGSYGFIIGSVHPDDNGLTLRSMRVGRIGLGYYTLATTSRSAEGGGANPGSSPLDEPPEIEMTFASAEGELDQDINGVPILTKNGEPLNGASDEINELVLTVSRNLPAWDYLLANTYMGSGKTPAATNSDTVLGFPPGAARLKGLGVKSVTSTGFVYYRATGTVQFRAAAPGSTVDKAWWLRIRHMGYKVRAAAGDAYSKWYHAIDGDGNKETQPVMIKLDGTRETNPLVGHWLEFQTSPSLPYGALGIFS